MPAARTSPALMADKKASLLSIIVGCANNNHVCPSLARLAILLRLGTNTIHEMLNSLRNDRVISWSLVPAFGTAGRVRVVRIVATGEMTAAPGIPTKQRGRPAKPPAPTFIGPPVRTLAGAEFLARKTELEAEAAKAARK